MKPSYSQYSGVSTDILDKLLFVKKVLKIEDLSKVPNKYLLDSKTLINSDSKTVLHLKNIQFKQVLKLYLNVSTKTEVITIIQEIELFDEVLYVGPNYICKQDSVTPNDNYINNQWSFNSIDGVNIFDAWAFSSGSSKIRVGIIDSGISLHNDLNANVVNGEDYFNSNNVTTDDEAGHGTNVAGIIGAIGNNNIGISGVCQSISLVPMQTIYDSSDTGYHDNDSVIESIREARDMWDTENRISVINYSVSGFGTSPDILAVIEQYQGLFVWSAGNSKQNLDNLPNIGDYNLDNLISVGAIDINNNLSVWGTESGSNYGNAVNIFAPGTDVLTTNLISECEWDVIFPDGYRLCELKEQYIDMYFDYINNGIRLENGDIVVPPNNPELVLQILNNILNSEENVFSSHHLGMGYHTVSGTSFSAPHVTGVAALLLSINPNLEVEDLKSAILDSADIIPITVPDTSEGSNDGDMTVQSVKKLNAFNAVKEVLKNYCSYSNYSLNNINGVVNMSRNTPNDGAYYGLNDFFKLSVPYEKNYEFTISSLYGVNAILCDQNFNVISYDDLNSSNNTIQFSKNLNVGTYYLITNFTNEFSSGDILTQIKFTPNLVLGNNNILNAYTSDNYDYLFTNNIGGGFYKITLNATTSSGTIEYPDGCLKVYEDETKQQLLPRLETVYYTLDAETQDDSNNLIVFLEYEQPYCINIDLPSDTYSSMNINVERLSDTYDITESNTNEEHIVLDGNTTAYGDFIQRIEVFQAGTYTISFVHNGPQSEENLMGQEDPLYLYYAFYKEIYTPAEEFGELEMIFPHIASSMGGTISFTFNLQPGIYYIGYYNKLNNQPMTISITS